MKTLLQMIALLAFTSVTTLSSSAIAQGQGDPLESYNRAMFAINEGIDTVLLRPIAQGYRFITPEYARKGVNNALRNLGEPIVMVNALLQADFDRFFTSGWRFILNSTFGFAGVYDIAGEYGGLPYRREDFGQTLGVWMNDTDSTYIVLPIMGPSTVRDTFGRVADIFIDPWGYGLQTDERVVLAVSEAIAQREALLDPLDEVYRTSFDPYSTIRSAYQQRRKAQILNRHSAKRHGL
jgi:phospholipid-binding lipoprotein MlaA